MYVDVIIPTYKPDAKLIELLEMLEKQSVLPFKIVLVNTEKKYFDELSGIYEIIEKYKNIKVYHIGKEEFDHGRTRNLGASYSDADFMLFMTDDAVPTDINLIKNLIDAFDDDSIAVAYARQVAVSGATEIETYGRIFNYPEESVVKSKDDIDRLGIKTFFCSDVCAMYRASLFRSRGGFINKAIFNEDMVYAGNVVLDGYKIAYVANAIVSHSHSYGLVEQFKRNFDIGVSQADHPEIFTLAKSEGEGIKLVKGTIKYLCKKGKWYVIPYFCINCAFKLIGYKKGKNYKNLSKKKILKYTSNLEYWKSV